ncbi:L-histidine N(alpha)-methyltransferase [Gloeobacter morelensis]|uniref:L-histidine N(Alpha)-methyltransferase n=1 Tax=Gloeobacter morelensis MG652769 TaxID=2781736 RepID=A0ABY3PPC0_9CYAN|nr:L-histidine N(alpha)-methyltransferase [Gloeobacter morelensis]UFP95484.1 L-histidine N(alpha)-methyltransferase [Gloeobacter morelensis MG652769]
MSLSQSMTQREALLRLHVEHLATVAVVAGEGADVVAGLSASAKTLPPRYFYDDAGSALFERICGLEEYYLTRTETAILQERSAEIARITGECELVELGSGSATKVRLLLDAYKKVRRRYLPIDVSAGILESSARQLLIDYPDLTVHGLVGTFEQGLAGLPATLLASRMIAFLGSTLGNLTPAECDAFFGRVGAALAPGEYFLLGVDLHKDTATLEAAYNDREGITAQFNLNMLRHLNWRYGGNFNLDRFRHVAFYHEQARQIEIYLESLEAQSVRLERLDLTVQLAAGEAIMTEISRKFDLDGLAAELQSHGLAAIQRYSDPVRRFGLLLCRRF